MLARLPLRVRVTAAFTLVMALVLAATGLFLYLRLAADLDETIDDRLHARAAAGTLTVADDDDFAQRVSEAGLLTAAELARARRGEVMLERDHLGPEREPARLLAKPASGGGVLVVGTYIDDRRDTLNSLAVLMAIGGPIALLLASLAGYGVASAALKPVEAMRRRAAAIGAGEPGARLPVPPSRDELARLGTTLNDMLARLEAALERERALVADASHELRTPLAVLKTELELALRRPRSREELEATVRAAADQADRLARLAEDLLVLAQSDESELAVHMEDVAIRDLLARVARRFDGVTAEDNDLRLRADRLRLEQALGNLVDNALRHGGGSVTLSAERADGGVQLHVRDDGPGFPEAFLPTAFERFTRADAGRSGSGAGLGLAIAEAIAHAHGGTARAANRRAGGADVWIQLPSSESDSTTTRP